MIILIDADKTFGNMQHLLGIKILSKLRIDENVST